MSQKFDTSAKSLFRVEGHTLIPLLVRGAELLSALNVEVLPPPMRTDCTYRVTYSSSPHILHFEYQADGDSDMIYRLLIYCALLLREHKLPVICVVIYLFHTPLPEGQLKFDIDGEEWLHFRFIVIALWKLDARVFVKRKDISIYPLLPAMGHADAGLLLQAIEEMVQYYKETELTDRLLWFSVFLRRTDTISAEDKLQVKERLQMFQQLLEQDEWIREIRAQSEQKGKQEGKQEGIQIGLQRGQLKQLHHMIFHLINSQYPSLKELAEQRVLHNTNIAQLQLALDQMIETPTKLMVRTILTKLPVIKADQQ